jgi:hypothetical protein
MLGYEPKIDPRFGLGDMVRSYVEAGWLRSDAATQARRPHAAHGS